MKIETNVIHLLEQLVRDENCFGIIIVVLTDGNISRRKKKYKKSSFKNRFEALKASCYHIAAEFGITMMCF
jgi:hypothetical protein